MTTTSRPGAEAAADAAAEAAHLLDNPVYAALCGPHAHLAERRGNVLRYPPDVAPFLALPDNPDAQDWADLAALVGPGGIVPLAGTGAPPPDGWQIVMRGAGVQMVADRVAGVADPEAIRLTTADVPDMLALIERTKPGPFLPRTIELGAYLGIRRHGELIALAGERLRLPGWTEISAVCTDVPYRGQGLATRLIRAVAHGIQQRGDIPFLHAVATNTTAILLYESLGFRRRRDLVFQASRVPDELGAG